MGRRGMAFRLRCGLSTSLQLEGPQFAGCPVNLDPTRKHELTGWEKSLVTRVWRVRESGAEWFRNPRAVEEGSLQHLHSAFTRFQSSGQQTRSRAVPDVTNRLSPAAAQDQNWSGACVSGV